MSYQIKQNKLTDEIKKRIFEGFSRYAINATGIDGLDESISFEIFDASEFVGAIVVQPFWGQLHIKYLFVEEQYRGLGLAKKLMDRALEFGKNLGCQFAFVETMSFQAPEFYKKMGFFNEFSREGYAKNTAFHYLKKPITNSSVRKITRTGVYGVAVNDGRILLVTQKKGPFAGKLDFPGGGIEFGESPEDALRREFMEEVRMTFDSLSLLDNLTNTTEVPPIAAKEPFTFYQIGMIYQVVGLRKLGDDNFGDLESKWYEITTLSQENCSGLLWKLLETRVL